MRSTSQTAGSRRLVEQSQEVANDRTSGGAVRLQSGMPKQALREALDQVERTLSEPEGLDHDDLNALSSLQADIERVLEQTEELHRGAGQRINEGSLSAVERLEVSHPTLTNVLGRVAHALAAMGI